MAPDADVPQLARLVSEFVAADPEAAISYAGAGYESVPTALHVPLLDHLAALATGDTQALRASAGSAIVALDPSDTHGRLLSAVERSIERGLFNRANAFLTENRKVLKPHLAHFVDQTNARLPTVTADALSRGLALASSLVSEASEEQRDRLRDILAELLRSDDSASVTAAAETIRRLGETDDFGDRARELVKIAFDHIKATSPAPEAALVFVAEHVGLLGRLERRAFVTHLATLIRDATQRSSALAAARLLPGLEPDERTEIVRALVEVEIMDTTPSNRIEYLRLARALATNRGNAARLVKERLEELANGTDADREIRDAAMAE